MKIVENDFRKAMREAYRIGRIQGFEDSLEQYINKIIIENAWQEDNLEEE